MEIRMENDDDLSKFEAEGAAPLPAPNDQGYVEHDGARICYAAYGSGSPVSPNLPSAFHRRSPERLRSR